MRATNFKRRVRETKWNAPLHCPDMVRYATAARTLQTGLTH